MKSFPRPTWTYWRSNSPCSESSRILQDLLDKSPTVQAYLRPRSSQVNIIKRCHRVIRQTFRRYFSKNKCTFLEELARHALSSSDLELGNNLQEQEHSRPDLTNVQNWNGCIIMNTEVIASYESLLDIANRGLLTLWKLLTTLERLVVVSSQLGTDVIITTDLEQVSSCRKYLVYLD